MNMLRDLSNADVLAAAEQALARAWGRSVQIRDVEMLSDEERRNLILRGNAVPAGDHGRSIIIKATRSTNYDPAAENAFEELGLIKEWAAMCFLAARAPRRGHGATMLAGDTRLGILVFEDLGAALDSLVGPLLHGSWQEAQRALIAYASALGRLHADAAGCSEEHARALLADFPAIRRAAPDRLRRLEKSAASIRDRIGGEPPQDELAQIARRLEQPGTWLSLVHGDPCPDNALISAQRIHLIDFEFAMPGHALLDAVYWRMGFPTCWCAGRVPDSIAAQVEAAYRAEIGLVMAGASNDAIFALESAFMAAAWLLRSLAARLEAAWNDDSRWGIASVRSRLLWYLEVTIRMTEESDILPGFRSVARIWLVDLRNRWPSTATLGLYPAFDIHSG
jgi:aminoglycoside/choline kinase family phosphotransferase